MSNEELQQEELQEETEQLESSEIEHTETKESDEKEAGYISKEDWVAQGRDPNKWRDPETYDKFGSLIQQNQRLKQRLYQNEHTLNALANKFITVREKERKDVEAQLRREFSKAVDEGDTRAALEVQERLTNTKLQHQAEEQQERSQMAPNPGQRSGQEFVARNPQWFIPGVPAEYSPHYQDVLRLQHKYATDYKAKGMDPAVYIDDILMDVETEMKESNPNINNVTAKPKVNPLSSPRSQEGKVTTSNDRHFNKLSKSDQQLYSATKSLLANCNGGKGIEYSVEEFLASK